MNKQGEHDCNAVNVEGLRGGALARHEQNVAISALETTVMQKLGDHLSKQFIVTYVGERSKDAADQCRRLLAKSLGQSQVLEQQAEDVTAKEPLEANAAAECAFPADTQSPTQACMTPINGSAASCFEQPSDFRSLFLIRCVFFILWKAR